MMDTIGTWLASANLIVGVRALLLLVAGFVAASVVSRMVVRAMSARLTVHHLQLTRRVLFYAVLTLFVASALHQLGFNLAVLVGAAGVLTVAIGFASQTSVSNLISGLFLIGERPFEVGDMIQVGSTVGEVLSIDALSVKLRTFDNLYVRIPNETLIKSEVTTMTRFPIRRLDVKVGVAYKESIPRVRDVLMSVAERNLRCLDDPPPLFIFLGFGDSSLDIQFSVWAKRENFLELRNSIHADIKTAFDGAGIEIPFPHRSLYTGEVTKPFPIQIVNGVANGQADGRGVEASAASPTEQRGEERD
jgi:small-conductance mechanosensitive channel